MASPESTDDRPNPFKGRTIARVLVGDRIGAGRTSHVFAGHYEPLDREIAIKILSDDYADHEEMRETFLLEARAVAKIDHPNIVKVLDVVEDQDCLCILMEYVPGETLQELVDREGKLPPAKALRIAREMAAALAAAHAEKIVHRDVKPANVILTGSDETVKVVDFGLAGRKDVANRAGTPLFMSPEACQGKRIDEKSDVYALGISLYRMLTGAFPYTGKSVRAILAAHVKADLTPVSEVLPTLGSTYDALIKRLLVPSKGYRPTAEEVVAELDELLEAHRPGKTAGGGRKGGRGGKGAAKSAGGARGGRRRPAAQKKSNGPVIGGVIGIVALLAVGAFLAMGNGDKGTAPANPSGGDTGTTSSTDTNGGGGISSGGTTDPEPASAAETAAETAAQTAFDAAVAEAAKHPDDPERRAALFREVVLAHKGTEVAKQAGAKFKEAKAEAEQAAAAAEAERDKERERQKAERLETATKERDKIRAALNVLDFDAAAASAKHHSGLPGENPTAWRKELRRIEYLSAEFVPRVSDAIEAYGGISAREWFEEAPPEAELTGATSQGLTYVWDGGEASIPWSKFKDQRKHLFNRIRKSMSSDDAQAQLFVAILAAQMFHDDGGADHRQSKSAREVVDLIDETGTVRRELGDYFVSP